MIYRLWCVSLGAHTRFLTTTILTVRITNDNTHFDQSTGLNFCDRIIAGRYEVLRGERAKSIAGMRDVNALLELHFVHEIIPVGSKGILKEATIDMSKSAGPATVVLCAIAPSRWPELQEIIHKQ